MPEASQWGVDALSFNDFRLKADEMVLAAIRMFMDTGLIQTFKIDYEVDRKRCGNDITESCGIWHGDRSVETSSIISINDLERCRWK